MYIFFYSQHFSSNFNHFIATISQTYEIRYDYIDDDVENINDGDDNDHGGNIDDDDHEDDDHDDHTS